MNMKNKMPTFLEADKEPLVNLYPVGKIVFRKGSWPAYIRPLMVIAVLDGRLLLNDMAEAQPEDIFIPDYYE
jgi:hypothetical protein